MYMKHMGISYFDAGFITKISHFICCPTLDSVVTKHCPKATWELEKLMWLILPGDKQSIKEGNQSKNSSRNLETGMQGP